MLNFNVSLKVDVVINPSFVGLIKEIGLILLSERIFELLMQ
jgi:hypothetical protein